MDDVSWTPLDWIDIELTDLTRRHLYRELSTHSGSQGPLLRTLDQELVNFGSNDYLSLAADPRLVLASVRAMEREGCGSGASPLVTGRGESHCELETSLAEFEGTEAALVFPSGFAANLGTIRALVGEGDAVFSDELNHASIIDGCRLSRAKVFVYPHGDLGILAQQLAAARTYTRRLIVTDTVFSMGGDLAPLVQLAELAQQFEAMLMADEAHATGVFGAHGQGVIEELSLEKRVHVRLGTLSKALGSAGGFVCGPRPLIDWLVNRARSYIFSTALPAVACAAGLAALDAIRAEPTRGMAVLRRAAGLRDRLRQQGWDVGASFSQIIPLVIGDADRTVRLSARLRARGFLVPAIRPPSVPDQKSLLRLSVCWGHSEAMLEGVAEALAHEITMLAR